MRIRIVLTALVVAMVGWAGCRNLPTSPEAKDVLNTLSVSPDSTPQLQSGYIYWTNVAWGFVERERNWRCGIESLFPLRYKYRYTYWLTITTEDYEPGWYNYIFRWYITDLNVPAYGNLYHWIIDSDVIIDWPDHHRVRTGYTFESCQLRFDIILRVGRKVYDKAGRVLHFHVTPYHAVRVRPLW